MIKITVSFFVQKQSKQDLFLPHLKSNYVLEFQCNKTVLRGAIGAKRTVISNERRHNDLKCRFAPKIALTMRDFKGLKVYIMTNI